MADDKMTGFSSAFDSLMDRARKRFEAHSAGTFNRGPDRSAGAARLRAAPQATPPATAPSSVVPSAPVSAVSPLKSSELSNRAPYTREPSPEGPPKPKRRKSAAVRRLNERYGEGWSYEVAERRREGDELIVLCRVDIPDKDISKTQFGSAKVLKPGEPFTVKGTADGVPIGIAVGRGAPVTRDPEESAFRRAVDVALAKCAELL